MTGSMSGAALLVPVAVDVLVITDNGFNDLGWSWNTPNYAMIEFFAPATGILQPTPPQPRTPDGTIGRTGTVLRWALPDALTHGGTVDETTGAPQFPAIPNRWLVQRRVNGHPEADSTWIIASDYVGGGGTSYPVGTAATSLGRCWELSAWPGEAALPAGLTPPLTALGPGDPSFAAFTPNVQHILAFHDPLTGVGAGTIAYLVAGWYAGGVPDPLAAAPTATGAQWTAQLDGLRWSVGDDLADASAAALDWLAAHGAPGDPTKPATYLPARTVCHGMASGVGWPGVDGQPVTGIPQLDPSDPATLPVITVAHTAADALATVVATAAGHQDTDVTEALAALLNDLLPLLDDADGKQQLAMHLQETWFRQVSGGVLWRLDPPEQDPRATTVPTPSAQQSALLDALNTAQHFLDATTRTLATLQAEVYDLWWKQQYLARDGAPAHVPNAAQLVQDAFATTTADTSAAIGTWRAAAADLDAAHQAMVEGTGNLVLRCVPEPAFWRPNDPLVMVQGVGRSYAHGEDGRYTEDGSLFCRVSGQTIAALLVTGSTAPVGAATLGLPSLTGTDLPPEVASLSAEAFFLDPGNAGTLAAAADPAQPQPASVVAAQQTLMWNSLSDVPLDQQTLAEVAGLQSEYGAVTVPSKVAVTYWSPPWSPLYLDWSVNYHPTGTRQTGWVFPATGATDALAEQTAGWGGTPPAEQSPLQGRALLTPQATDAMAARLTQLLAQFGDDPELRPYVADVNDAIDYLQHACVLAQSLTGFYDLVLQRDPTMFQLPDLTTLGAWLTPDGVPSFAPAAAPIPGGATPFTPVSGGFINLHQLWVVDGFGQRYDVLATVAANASPHGYQLGADLGPQTSSGLTPLRPRLPQPSRLVLDFLDATDDTRRIGRSSGADPVCGWLLPDRLDNAVLVYDTAGIMQGELIVERNTAVWLPAADQVPPQAQTDPPALANSHLDALIAGILSSANSGGALADLIATIQRASWAISAPGPADKLGALIGFPVAVVRGQLTLEQYGRRATRQTWATTGQQDDGGMGSATIVVALGSADMDDDGLIGALTDADPGHLVSPYGASANGYALAGTCHLVPEQPLGLTLLMHPNAKVHAFSGVLPPTVAVLPPRSRTAPSETMAVTFRCGPLLTPAAEISAPIPFFGNGDWSWLEYHTTASPATPRPVVTADATARLLDTAPVLHDGWLRLDLVPQPTALHYAISPSGVQSGRAAALQLIAYNAADRPVSCSAIQLSVPVGTAATAVSTAPPSVAVAPEQAASWSVQPVDGRAGVYLARPVTSGAVVEAGASVTFLLTGLDVPAQPGAALLGIEETTDAEQVHLDLVVEKTLGVPA